MTLATVLCPDGHPNPAGGNFCSQCGKPLTADQPPNVTETETPPAPPAAPEATVPTVAPARDTKERRKVPIVPVIIGAIILVAITSFLVLRPKHHTIDGSLSAPECGGGYEIVNANVEVRDQDNKLIGSTTTGFDDRDAAQCSVTFTVDVPKADYYQIKIGTLTRWSRTTGSWI
jgi:hypothetical protein